MNWMKSKVGKNNSAESVGNAQEALSSKGTLRILKEELNKKRLKDTKTDYLIRV